MPAAPGELLISAQLRGYESADCGGADDGTHAEISLLWRYARTGSIAGVSPAFGGAIVGSPNCAASPNGDVFCSLLAEAFPDGQPFAIGIGAGGRLMLSDTSSAVDSDGMPSAWDSAVILPA